MKKIILLLILSICFNLLFSSDDKIQLHRFRDKVDKETFETHKTFQKKTHPFQDYFNRKNQDFRPNTRSANFDKLLVLLVDFKEDDDPKTTGNGKFRLQAEPDYPFSLGAPPYNREFFEMQMEAMKYYYRAASFEGYQLKYEVYPKSENTAYTLSKEMSYYNPIESELFLERIMEYFHEIFQVADSAVGADRPNFREYGHFMVIHAGSNWQNDASGDTPHDIPSFYITFGSDVKPVIVDGDFVIHSVANVPEFLTQDVWDRYMGYYENEDGSRQEVHYVYGYSLINGVYAHEFGHSLGFADLYNTNLGWPAVGVFDIMDSGGSEAFLMEGTQIIEGADYYYILEGGVPTLPSPWSRIIVWEDYFLSQGYLVDINEISPDGEFKILSSSQKRESSDSNIPYFYRLRLSSDEYLLIENRNPDPDGDGGTGFQGALSNSQGPRVMLHPSPVDRFDNRFIYEYDWLLPSWLDVEGVIKGGGLLIWHIDEYQIYKQGEWVDVYQDGVFVKREFLTNFDLNRVNTNFRGHYAVRVIEADGIVDLGDPYSFWTGTPYEYFYKYKPKLDDAGYWIDWQYDKIHNSELSSSSKPALLTNSGLPSIWKISDIGQADRIMSFKVSNSMFTETRSVGRFKNLYSVSPMAINAGEILFQIINQDSLSLYSYTGHDWAAKYSNNLVYSKPDFDIVKTNINSDDYYEFLTVFGKKIVITDGVKYFEHTFENEITQAPLYFKQGGESFLLLIHEDDIGYALYTVSADDGGYKIELYEETPHTGKVAWDGQKLYVITKNNLNITDFQDNISISLSEDFTKFEPVVYTDIYHQTILSLMSDNYNIYNLTEDRGLTKIFEISKYTKSTPSQLALGYSADNISYFIMFHTQNQVFVMSEDGSFLSGFPLTIENRSLDTDSHPHIFEIDSQVVFLLHDTQQGILGVDLNGRVRRDYSLYWNSGEIRPVFSVVNNELIMVYSDFNTDNDESSVYAAKLIPERKVSILWNGFRNGYTGVLNRTEYTDPIFPPMAKKVEVYVYPSPVKQMFGRVRINNTKAKAKVSIFNIIGQKVFEVNSPESVEDFRDIEFNTQRLSSGSYFVMVEVNGKTHTHKFAIVK